MTPARGRPRAGTRVALALGSNLGRRRAHLTWALRQLAGIVDELEASPFVDTAPVEVAEPQPRYLNGVAIGRTSLTAPALLDACLAIERKRGRIRTGPKSPRTLDIDLILYGGAIIDTPYLRVPHPRFRERDFVLGPLAALAPRWKDPETGKTLARLWREHRLPVGGETAVPPASNTLSGSRAPRGRRGAGRR